MILKLTQVLVELLLNFVTGILLFIKRTDLSDLQECIVAETTVDKKCFLTCLYRSPSQNNDEFETFSSDLIFLLNNINKFQPSCSVLLGDFIAKHSKLCSTDKNNKAGTALKNFTSTVVIIKLLINQPILRTFHHLALI